MILTRIELTKLGGVGVGQALQEVLHLGLAHVVQVDQGIEAVELLEPLLGPLRDLAGLHLALRVEGKEDGVEDVHVDQGGVVPWVALLLLHLVLWGKVKVKILTMVTSKTNSPFHTRSAQNSRES